MSLITSGDMAYMTGALAQVGSFVEQPVTIFHSGTLTYGGTTAESGDPASTSFGTRSTYARVENVSVALIEKSDGRYFASDKKVTMRGSFTNADMVVHSTGTYRPVDGPWKHYIGSNLIWQAVCREVQS